MGATASTRLSRAERSAALRQVGFGRSLPPEALDVLTDIAIERREPAGSLLQIEGDPAEAMFVMVAGRAKIVRISSAGREQVLHVVEAGEHFNGVPLFDDGPCPATVEALTDLTVLALPRAALRDAVGRHPALALALLKDFTGRLRLLVDLVESLALQTVQGRLAALLLAEDEARARGETPPPLTQADMAGRLGTVREMVGRTLKSFDAQGLIHLDRGAVTVIDREGLAALAER
jgi:CRP-like cAMP-binding protein